MAVGVFRYTDAVQENEAGSQGVWLGIWRVDWTRKLCRERPIVWYSVGGEIHQKDEEAGGGRSRWIGW